MSGESQKQSSNNLELPENFVKEIEEVVKEKRLNKEQRKKLEDEVYKVYAKSRLEPGEALGIISAQSISEPATQMTMRTYHFAGSAGIRITYGLPRLIEIFDAKKESETPMMTIFLKKEFNNKETAEDIANEIIEKRVSDVARRIIINLNENSVEIEPSDLKKMGRILNSLKAGLPESKIKERSKDIVVFPKEEINVKELQKLKDKVRDLKVSGIKGITNAVVRKEEDDWIINTIGSNLKEVFMIKEVDETKTITNDIYETMKVLGIEAARNLIISEALKTLQEQALDVDIRHVMLVGDIMTLNGEIMSIGRYGVAGAKSSILARAAFEETIKHLVRASIRNEIDSFQGIFENVMVGQVIPSGTGMFDLVAQFEE